ncbi:hypothetical protein LRH25_28780 [Ideonella azotifigens]|uniref:Uncharacterized protein n=1 Tax=Ideonella azotifigens TaxID=513160 RepID=A0ABN1K4H0_9BURK|nr:hypothetical protein [Ideonella azotifigens]MCD2344324.1 hypothetical protein [Ideonella azotifigens]
MTDPTLPRPASPPPASEPQAAVAPADARQQQLFRHTLRESRIHPLAPLLRRYRSLRTPAAPNSDEETRHA